MSFIKSFIADMVRVHNPHDTHSFLLGFLAGAEAFAIWKDGEQILGVGTETMKTLKKAVKEYTEDQA